MKILVLQHATFEHPGIFRRFLEEDGHEWVPVLLHEGETPPSLDGFDGLWVMGGVMDVWEEDQYPWLIGEKALIRDAVMERGLPFLGFCLGHQLLAVALGGECAKAARPEVGVMDVQLTEAGATGILFDDVPEIFPALQWHGVEVIRLPEGAQCLATSPDCAVQAMRWQTRAYSLQFHMEIERESLDPWFRTPSNRDWLTENFGPDKPDRMIADCAANMDRFNTIAERIYRNWLQTSAQV